MVWFLVFSERPGILILQEPHAPFQFCILEFVKVSPRFKLREGALTVVIVSIVEPSIVASLEL